MFCTAGLDLFNWLDVDEEEEEEEEDDDDDVEEPDEPGGFVASTHSLVHKYFDKWFTKIIKKDLVT